MSVLLLSECERESKETHIEHAKSAIDCFAKEESKQSSTYHYRAGKETISNLIESLLQIDDETTVRYFVEKCKDLVSVTALVDHFGFFEKFSSIVESAFLRALPKFYESEPNKVILSVIDFAKKCSDGDDKRKDKLSEFAATILPNLVAIMQPNVLAASVPLKETLNADSVKSFLSIFNQTIPSIPTSKIDCPALARDFISAVTWASCQKVSKPQSSIANYQYSFSITTVANNSTFPIVGPRELVNAGVRKLCVKHGWRHFEGVMSDVVEKLCQNGSIAHAVSLVHEIALPLNGRGEQSEQYHVCAKVAKHLLTLDGQALVKQASISWGKADEVLICQYFAVCDAFKPDLLSDFVGVIKALDDKKGAQLVLKLSETKYSSDSAKATLDELVRHCAGKVSEEASSPIETINTWLLPSNLAIFAGLPAEVTKFLRSPCKQTLSFQLAKKDHNLLCSQVGAFTRAKVLTATPYRPPGTNYWHVKLEKLRQRSMPANEVWGCSCAPQPSSSSYGGYTSSYGSGKSPWNPINPAQKCLLASTKTKLESQKKAMALFDQLLQHLPEDARFKYGKRKAPSEQNHVASKKAKEDVEVVDLT